MLSNKLEHNQMLITIKEGENGSKIIELETRQKTKRFDICPRDDISIAIGECIKLYWEGKDVCVTDMWLKRMCGYEQSINTLSPDEKWEYDTRKSCIDCN